jgi:KDO2-lipid IV(A) lauroyltransferase
VRFAEVGTSAVRAILSGLRSREVVGFLADRDVAATGAPLPFFERTTRMTTAPATFARRTGATVLTCTTHRTGLWRGVAIIDPPVEIPHAQDVNTDVLEGTRRIIARLESYIRRDPEQWTVFSDIWPAPEAPEPVGAPG